VPGLYLDTSAIGRLVLSEPDATAIRALLARYGAYCSSALFAVEVGAERGPRNARLPAIGKAVRGGDVLDLGEVDL
jgi:uncharacterized protein with PIN domain